MVQCSDEWFFKLYGARNLRSLFGRQPRSLRTRQHRPQPVPRARLSVDNLSLFKSFPVFRESQLEARFDAFNATNTPAFGLPSSSITSSTFGQITGALGSGAGNVNGVGGPRVLQAAVKITF